MKLKLWTLAALLITLSGYAQENGKENHKGRFYAAWGWNRAQYSNSDMRFVGKDYDFTLKDVKATDRPTGFRPGIYFNPVTLTIPQTNFRLGYYLNEHYSVCFGFDHMKYVMTQYQHVKVSGTIKNSGTEYDGTYDNADLELKTDFLEFENTDGLNYVQFEINRHDRLLGAKKENGTESIGLYVVNGLSLGGMYPRTDSHLLNNRRNNKYHVAGYGSGLKTALRLEFLKYFYVQGEFKAGYINMPYLRPTEFHSEKAQQHFYYRQVNVHFGAIFRLPHKKSPIG